MRYGNLQHIGLLAILLLLALPTPSFGSANQGEAITPPQRAVRLLRIQLPLVGNADRLYQSRLQRAVQLLTKEAGEESRPLLVLEFVPAPEGAATEFERALSLARYLVSPSMASVKTLAYLPSSLEGHAVLAALACEEIAMGTWCRDRSRLKRRDPPARYSNRASALPMPKSPRRVEPLPPRSPWQWSIRRLSYCASKRTVAIGTHFAKTSNRSKRI